MTSKDFRIEKDSLGEVKVPASALYGAQTQRAVENFPISGLHPWRAFIWSIAAVKRAAALVNYELGLFNDREVSSNPARNIGETQENEQGRRFDRAATGGCCCPGRRGSDGWQMGRSICGRSIPGWRGDEPQHECQ